MMMTLAAVLCCAMTTTVFTACGSDDDNNNNDPSQKDLPATCDMTVTLITDDETLTSFDFYFKYYDENGQVKSEKVVYDEKLNADGLRTCTKKVTAKLPAMLGALYEAKLKEGVDLSVKHSYCRGHEIMFASYTASGKVIDYYKPAWGYIITNISGVFPEEQSRVLDITDQFNSEGKGTVGKWN